MAVAGGAVQEFDWLAQRPERGTFSRWAHAIGTFARKKPLGSVCGFIVVLSLIIGDFFPATTGEIVHVDGGFHAMGL